MIADKVRNIVVLNTDKFLSLLSLLVKPDEDVIKASIFESIPAENVNGLSKTLYYRFFTAVYSIVNIVTMHIHRRQSQLLIDLLNRANAEGYFPSAVANNPHNLSDMTYNCKDAAVAKYFKTYIQHDLHKRLPHYPSMDYLDILDAPFFQNHIPRVGNRYISHPIWVAGGHCFLPVITPEKNVPVFSAKTHLLIRMDNGQVNPKGNDMFWLECEKPISQLLNLRVEDSPKTTKTFKDFIKLFDVRTIGLEFKEPTPTYAKCTRTRGDCVYSNDLSTGLILTKLPPLLPLEHLPALYFQMNGVINKRTLIDIDNNTFYWPGSNEGHYQYVDLQPKEYPLTFGCSMDGSADLYTLNQCFIPYITQFHANAAPVLSYPWGKVPLNAPKNRLGGMNQDGIVFSYENKFTFCFRVSQFPVSMVDCPHIFQLRYQLVDTVNESCFVGFSQLRRDQMPGCIRCSVNLLNPYTGPSRRLRMETRSVS